MSKKRGISSHFRQRCRIRTYNRTPARHGFQYGKAETFIAGWKHKECSVLIKFNQAFIADDARKNYVPSYAGFCYTLAYILTPTKISGKNEVICGLETLRQKAECID